MRENAESSKFITQATLVLRNGHLPPPPTPPPIPTTGPALGRASPAPSLGSVTHNPELLQDPRQGAPLGLHDKGRVLGDRVRS